MKYKVKRSLSEGVNIMGQVNNVFFFEMQGKEVTFGRRRNNGLIEKCLLAIIKGERTLFESASSCCLAAVATIANYFKHTLVSAADFHERHFIFVVKSE